MTKGLTQLEGLVAKVVDVLESRIDSNTRAVQAARLMDLPLERTFTHEEFMTHQVAFAKRQSERLAVR